MVVLIKKYFKNNIKIITPLKWGWIKNNYKITVTNCGFKGNCKTTVCNCGFKETSFKTAVSNCGSNRNYKTTVCNYDFKEISISFKTTITNGDFLYLKSMWCLRGQRRLLWQIFSNGYYSYHFFLQINYFDLKLGEGGGDTWQGLSEWWRIKKRWREVDERWWWMECDGRSMLTKYWIFNRFGLFLSPSPPLGHVSYCGPPKTISRQFTPRSYVRIGERHEGNSRLILIVIHL